jgi:AAA+ ATPase superfamily predicted ATPase
LTDREAELKGLGDLWAEGQAQLVIVYGRRRVGKTELLTQFCRDKRAHYFLATQTKDAENLRAFVRVLRQRMAHPVLADGVMPTWEALLEALASEAASKPLAVVLDEFQYICRDRKDLPSPGW